MENITEILRADPFDPARLHIALERLGLTEAISTPGTGRKATNRAERLIHDLARTPAERIALYEGLNELLDDIAQSPEPLRSLLNLARLAEACGDRTAFFQHLRERPAVRLRLCRLLSFSQALADTLIREPELMALLRNPLIPRSRAQFREAANMAIAGAQTNALDALRRFRRRETLRIGLIDLEGHTWRTPRDFDLAVRQISDLAQVCVERALHIAAAADNGDAASARGFCVIAMGKLGGRELNYSSDIDLIFIHDGETAAMGKLAQRLLKALNDSGPEGNFYRVDMRLRPEGKAGPLATSINYALNYYETYAAAWEWQALIKARAIAGDASLARRFRKFARGVTWAKRADDTHLRDILAMKRRSEGTSEGSDQANVKQGPGGIRDAEWVVQQLQMMVGPAHPRARAATMLRALAKLYELDAITYGEARILRGGYLFLRVLEHRLQLLEERPVRCIPTDLAERAALARRLGCRQRGSAAAAWLEEEHGRVRAEIRGLCERMFWRWRDIESGDEPDSDLHELEIAGLPDNEDSRNRLSRLRSGTQTHPLPGPLARQMSLALPPALRHLPHAANPERALANLERLADTSGNRLSLLRTLGESSELSRAVFAILGGSQFLSDTMIRHPELLDLAARRTMLERPRFWPEARYACRDYCMAFFDRQAAVRRWKRREMLRIGLRDLALNAPPHEITAEIAALAQACLDIACEEIAGALQPASGRLGFAVVGMGKLGGGEMHYHSDADVLFAYSLPAPYEEAGALATSWSEELIRWLGEHTQEGIAYEVDARLRPLGRSGPLAPAVGGYIDYFERQINGIAVWERQALTRARYVAGDAGTAGQMQAAIRHVAFPEEWNSAWGDELRHIKNRVEHERAAHGAATGTVLDVKLGPGCLSDIEFCAQWLALKHGARIPALQTPNTPRQIEAAADAGLLQTDEAAALRAAYTFLRRAELRLQVTQEGTSRSVKKNSVEFTAWCRSVFPDRDDAAELFLNGWETQTAAARAIMERVRDSL